MPDVQNLITAIKQAEAAYEPSARIAERLRQITLVSLIGPSGVGKTTVLRTVPRLDPDFGRIITFMTRERRDDEDPDMYEFLKHDSRTLENILQQINNHELVQYIVHPTTSRVYGSHIDAYDRPYMLLETLPGAFASLERLPFKAVKKIALAADPAEWRSRFAERAEDSSKDETIKRLKEGISNLSWSLDHKDVIWLDNSHRPAEETARLLIGIVKGEVNYDGTAARQTGEALLATMHAVKHT